jgi:hypothetical protein
MGDEATIKEIIAEVDTDHVSHSTKYLENSSDYFLICHQRLEYENNHSCGL